jgi:hypothetical protein
MGTRSIIVITGPGVHRSHTTVRMYKHWDGYPTGVLEVLSEAIEQADKVLSNHKDEPFRTDLLVGKIIGADTGAYGQGARVDQDYTETSEKPAIYSEALEPGHLGNQGDLEWIYVVDLFEKNINVYAAGDEPSKTKLSKVTDPYSYTKQLVESAQQEEADAIASAIANLGKYGFLVNGTGKHKLKKV